MRRTTKLMRQISRHIHALCNVPATPRRANRLAYRGRSFDHSRALEPLESRVLLSADFVGPIAPFEHAAPPTIVPLVPQAPPSGHFGASSHNDDFADRVDLGSVLFVEVTGSNVGFTGETGEPTSGSFFGTPVDIEPLSSAWWSWTAPQDGQAFITTEGSDFDTILTVAVGDAVEDLFVIAQDDRIKPDSTSEVFFGVTAGETYHIAVDGYAGDEGAIALLVEMVVYSLGNDDFADSVDLGSDSVAFSQALNVGFTGETGEPADLFGMEPLSSAWWSWTAPSAGNVSVNVESFIFDFDAFFQFIPVITVATGDAVDDLTVITQVVGDDFGGFGGGQADFSATAGTTYHIAVDGLADQEGVISLNLNHFTDRGNDSFADSIDLNAEPFEISTGSNVGYDRQTGEPDQSSTVNSAWWSWTAPKDGLAGFSTRNSNIDTFLTIAVGDSVDDLTVLAQDGDEFGTIIIDLDVTAGTTYHIAVDGFEGQEGDIRVSVFLSDRFENDDFDNAFDLRSRSATGAFTTNLGFTGETGEPAQDGDIASAWWKWTAPADGGAVIHTVLTVGFDTILTVAVGDSVDDLTVLAQNDDHPDSVDGGSLVELDVTAGTTYYIAVDGKGDAQGFYSLDIGHFPDRGNDDFADSVDLGSVEFIDITDRNIGYDSETGEPAQDGTIASAWWSWTAPANGSLSINTLDFPSTLETFLTVATGDTVDALTVLGQQSGEFGAFFVAVTAGTTYHIAVDGLGDQEGSYSLDLFFHPAIMNDDFADRVDLGSDFFAFGDGSNVGFTGETGEPAQSGDIASAWWSWTAPTDGDISVTTFGSELDTFLTVATGASVDALTVLAQNDDDPFGFNGSSLIEMAVTGGTTYHIAVDGSGGDQGDYFFDLEFTPSGVEPPRVTGVRVDSTSWTDPALDGGVAIPVGSGEQLRPQKQGNIDLIHIEFSRELDPESIDTFSFIVSGENVFVYDYVHIYDAATRTVTLVFDEPIDNDRILLGVSDFLTADGARLDGEWDNPFSIDTISSDTFPSGDGEPGGRFLFTFFVLPGDPTGDGKVDAADLNLLALAWQQMNTPEARAADLTGDGKVDAADLNQLALNWQADSSVF